jgi:DNA polymerase-4
VFAVFRSTTPLVEGLSLDEAFLDVAGLRLHFDSPDEVAEMIRGRLRSELGLPASVGIASVKFIAKLASESAKPDGVRHVAVEDQRSFLASLPASSLWGVGPATQAALARLGVETIGDIASLPEASLSNAVGPTMGRQLHDLANGIDPRTVVPDSAAKSISVEETYDDDLATPELIETALLAHAQRLSARLRRAGVRGRTLTLKVRFADFATITRSHTDPVPIDGARQIFAIATELAGTRGRDDPVRLLGLGVSGLESSDQPAQLDLESSESWSRVEDAVAEVRTKFGEMAVKPARLAVGEKSDETGYQP